MQPELRNLRVWAEIDHTALVHNFNLIQSHVGRGCGVLGVIKSNAYGHGAVSVALTLERAGAAALGVCNVEEAIELRRAGTSLPILVLGGLADFELEPALQWGIDIPLSSERQLLVLNEICKRERRGARVQVVVDTGMGRLGASPLESAYLAHQVLRSKHLHLAGIESHFSSANEVSTQFSETQVERFQAVLDNVLPYCTHQPLVHMSSHAGLFRYQEAHFNLVRPGLALFGYSGVSGSITGELRPALSLHSRILHIKDVPADTPISYGRLYTTTGATRIATVSAGYNDGVPVSLTGKGHVLIEGRRCPIVGRVTMDYVMVDVTDVRELGLDSVVTIIGEQGDQRIGLDQIAEAAGMIPYEVSCGIGSRVARIHSKSQPVGRASLKLHAA